MSSFDTVLNKSMHDYDVMNRMVMDCTWEAHMTCGGMKHVTAGASVDWIL